MTNDTTNLTKFAILKNWLPTIIDTIRKDLKKDHLSKDVAFLKQYFSGKPVNKLTNEELAAGYAAALENEETAESVGEFITNRWLLKHADLYYLFEGHLVKINPDITQITSIEESVAAPIIDESVEQFGAIDTYLFCRMNSVAIPESIFERLEKRAQEEVGATKEKVKHESIEEVERQYERVIARLTDRYEKKLSSLERKYVQDTETLKKQIGNLQRKLAG